MAVGKVLYSREDESENDNIEKTFVLDLIEFMKIIKTNLNNKKSVKNSCKDFFYVSTLPFFEKWNNHNKIKKYLRMNSQYVSDYFSFGLYFNGSVILFPHRIISELLYNNECFLSQFEYSDEEDEDINGFLQKLWNINNKDNYSLNKNDIKIIKYYTSSDFISNNRRFTSQELLAKKISCDKRTISTRSTRLYESYIMAHTYLIDVTKLGYQTIVAIFSTENTTSETSISSFCLGKLPLNFGLSRGCFQIYQIPYWKNDIFYKIKKLNPIAVFELNQAYIGWNLSDLHQKPKLRWKNMPPIFINSSWKDEIISVNNGYHISLIPFFDQIKITQSHARMLMYFLENGTAKEIQLAEYSSVNKDSITRIWKFIENERLVIPYTTIRSIGLDLSLWVLAMTKEQEQSQFISNAMKHLSLFPHSRLYYSDSLLVGKISIPAFWLKHFIRVWKGLGDLGLISRCGMMDEIFHIKRNINILETLF